MLDLKTVLMNPRAIVEGAARKGLEADVETVSKRATERKALHRRLSELRRRVRELSGKGADPSDKPLARRLRDEASEVQKALRLSENELRRAMLGLPNPPEEGENDIESDRIERGVGGSVQTARRDALRETAPARAEAAAAEGLVEGLAERGYRRVIAPPVVTREALENAGFLPHWEGRLLRLDEGAYLSPRPETTLASLHAGKRLERGALPLCAAAVGWCFRPGGAGPSPAGPDLRQFRAIEIVRFEAPGTGREAFRRVLSDLLEGLAAVGVAGRIEARPPSKLSFSAAAAADILAGKGTRVGTASMYGTFLARRADTRLTGGGHPETVAGVLSLPRILEALRT